MPVFVERICSIANFYNCSVMLKYVWFSWMRFIEGSHFVLTVGSAFSLWRTHSRLLFSWPRQFSVSLVAPEGDGPDIRWSALVTGSAVGPSIIAERAIPANWKSPSQTVARQANI